MSRRTYVNAISVIGARDGTDIDSGTFCPTVTLIRLDQTEPRLAVEALFVADQMLHPQLAHVAERHRRAGFASLVRCHKVTDLILGRHLADSVEVDDVVEAAGLNADIDDAALGE